MHRDQILGLIDQYEEQFPSEGQTVSRLREFVIKHPDCFERSQLSGHVTGSAWIVNAAANAALLTHHKKLDIWVQLGGHADGDSNIQQVAEKEAEEESGLSGLSTLSGKIFDIDIHVIPARNNEPQHFHYDCRFLLQTVDEAFVVSDESHDLKWIPFDEIQQYTTEESVLRMVRKTPKFIASLNDN